MITALLSLFLSYETQSSSVINVLMLWLQLIILCQLAYVWLCVWPGPS